MSLGHLHKLFNTLHLHSSPSCCLLLSKEETLERNTIIHHHVAEARLQLHEVTLNCLAGLPAAGVRGPSFASAPEQRAHFRSDWHRHNARRRAAGRPALGEDDFERLVAADAELSSISGSESESDDEPGGRAAAARRRGCAGARACFTARGAPTFAFVVTVSRFNCKTSHALALRLGGAIASAHTRATPPFERIVDAWFLQVSGPMASFVACDCVKPLRLAAGASLLRPRCMPVLHVAATFFSSGVCLAQRSRPAAVAL